MIAFVFSGGGNRGALQVGAVQVLLERGIVPDILVGTSAGAINAAFLAPQPGLEMAVALEELWGKVTGDDVYPGSRLAIIWRLLRERTSLYPSDNLYAFLRRHMPPGVETFGDLTAARLFVVATRPATSQMHVFGEKPSDGLIDAIMASTALPPLHPPWEINGEYYVDGGAVADLPLRVAVQKGARVIYALHLPAVAGPLPLVHTVTDIASRAISALVHQQLTVDLEVASRSAGITLHHIELSPPDQPQLTYRDFSRSQELVALGRDQMERYLAQQPAPKPTRRERLAAKLRELTDAAPLIRSDLGDGAWLVRRSSSGDRSTT
jgi:NTE family protein